MVYSVFLYPINGEFDVDAVKRYLEAKPDVFLDPLGTTLASKSPTASFTPSLSSSSPT